MPTDKELADQYRKAWDDGDPEDLIIAENQIIVRLNIDPDETEQGLTDKACREIDLFVQTN